ncbi:hypothetical protein WJX72_003521 [[Myrmecia] bisecta]|uniref:Rieske domain-containing protein n=1 Tax=[Myrmecia] bisecta TaxID=41462 RepID=A0AAW1Q0S4_9CHLO
MEPIPLGRLGELHVQRMCTIRLKGSACPQAVYRSKHWRQPIHAQAGASRDGHPAHTDWYPVHYARDLVPGQPQRVTLFDEAIVVARRGGGLGPIAMVDRCPHRAAALSEGRITEDGRLQCAYHGWTFDGSSGQCTNIPQVEHGGVMMGKTCATALPACEHQGIVWVYPSPGATPSTSTIPGLPELDLEGWTSDDFIRDMPVDFSLLIENVADPDHGIWAHQTTNFDSFAASADYPMHVEVTQDTGRLQVTGKVPAVLKLTGKTEQERTKAMPGEKGTAAEQTAIITFEPPCMVRWSRHDAAGNTRFIAGFYAMPIGTGRTRFFTRYARNIAPKIHPPRWLIHIALNSFVDQDTYLLATQQEVTLSEEFKEIAAARTASSHSDGAEHGSSPLKRRRWYCHRSPSDNLLVTVGKWLDAALPTLPNRYTALLEAGAADGAAPIIRSEPREVVLDRFACQTALCPESMAAYNNLRRARTVCAVSAALGAVGLLSYAVAASLGGHLSWAATLKGGGLVSLAAAASLASHTLAKQFTYVYTRQKQVTDLAKLTKLTAHMGKTNVGADVKAGPR